MGAGSENSNDTEPSYPDGVPNAHKFGFIPIGVAGARAMDDPEEIISAACKRLNRPVRFIDGRGYEDEVTAAAIDPERDRIAWVEYRCKETRTGYFHVKFRLKTQTDGRPGINWVIDTYNPVFGCAVGYLAWHGERVVIIYREKHHTYACSLSPSGAKASVQVTDEWAVANGQVTFCSDEPHFVERLALPELTRFARISSEEARAAGSLPPGYEEANEWNIQWRSKSTSREKHGTLRRLLTAFFRIAERRPR